MCWLTAPCVSASSSAARVALRTAVSNAQRLQRRKVDASHAGISNTNVRHDNSSFAAGRHAFPLGSVFHNPSGHTTMNAYRLYLSPGACSLAAHIALEETGAPFDVEIVSVQKQQNLEARYLAINAKRVPVLAIPGEPHVLTETPAILTYLARRYPEAQLLPFGDPLREARCHEWLAWLVGWVHGGGARWRPGRFIGDPALHGEVAARAAHDRSRERGDRSARRRPRGRAGRAFDRRSVPVRAVSLGRRDRPT